MASANAAPNSIGTKILPADSGLRPMDSMALLTIIPIAKAGEIPPIAIVRPFAKVNMTSGDIKFSSGSSPFALLKPKLQGKDDFIKNKHQATKQIALCLFSMIFRSMGNRARHRHIGKTKNGEDCRLNKPNQQFKEHKWRRQKQGE